MLRERVVHPRVKVTLLADLTLATTSIVPFTLSIAVAQPPSILILLFLPSTFRQTLRRLFRPDFLLRGNFAASFCHVVGRRWSPFIPGSRLFSQQIRSVDRRISSLVSTPVPLDDRSLSRPSIFRTLRNTLQTRSICSSSRSRIQTRRVRWFVTISEEIESV